jgi:TRAP-type C4-dicarboxylate transport system substrate-binding protein
MNRDTLKLTWVLAHVPYDLFLRSAEAFSKAVSEKTDGAIEVEVLGKNEWQDKYNDGQEIGNRALLKKLEQGEIAMSQTYSTVLGLLNEDYYSLDMPFIFENHDHASRVLDGPVGEKLLNGLATTSGARGLAFTYSGGFKMIATNKEVHSIADFAGTVLRTGSSPVSEATFKAIGAETLPMGVDGFAQSVASGECEGGENVFPRYFRSAVNTVTDTVADTEHALFLTSIVISDAIWTSLSDEQRSVITECAKIAAVAEREESLIDGAAAKSRAVEEGIKVIEWTPEAIAEFKDATAPVYSQFDGYFSEDLVGQILDAK